ncbi:MAG TPA: tryptophan synthase subunit alpha [Deltaproteobacteria bacterium]|nr:tryptophan synthase subunit alpha [Deltaproteobacteria bacterium]HPP81218.1 tryptophan synthase subunit alpha [Deltaproteobacteria bacterium]
MIEERIRSTKRAVIPYVTAGLPDLDTTGDILDVLAAGGAAAIEIGIPFSDPVADGPVLQRASYLALKAGFRMCKLMERLGSWSARVSVPLVIMTYINPLMRKGLEDSLTALRDAGVQGVIIPDLPVDAGGIFDHCSRIGLDLVRLVAPTTKRARAREILSRCSGFVYAVSVKGVTGQRTSLPEGIDAQVASIRELTTLPVCVGFGVSRAGQVDELLGFADGVIVGSHLMQEVMSGTDPVERARDAFARLMNGSR